MQFTIISMAALGFAFTALSAPTPALSTATANAIQNLEITLENTIANIVDLDIATGTTNFEAAYAQLSALAGTGCTTPPPVVPDSATQVIQYLQTAQLDLRIIEQDMINGDMTDAQDGK